VAADVRDWVVEGPLRQQGTAVWQGLSVASRRASSHLRPWWDVHRYQIAPQLDRVLTQNQRSGRLKIVKGDISSMRLYEGSFHVALRLRRCARYPKVDRFFDAVVNCTGPDMGRSSSRTPCAALASSGQLRAEPRGLGIEGRCFARRHRRGRHAVTSPLRRGSVGAGVFRRAHGFAAVSQQPERLANYVLNCSKAQPDAPRRRRVTELYAPRHPAGSVG